MRAPRGYRCRNGTTIGGRCGRLAWKTTVIGKACRRCRRSWRTK